MYGNRPCVVKTFFWPKNLAGMKISPTFAADYRTHNRRVPEQTELFCFCLSDLNAKNNKIQ